MESSHISIRNIHEDIFPPGEWKAHSDGVVATLRKLGIGVPDSSWNGLLALQKQLEMEKSHLQEEYRVSTLPPSADLANSKSCEKGSGAPLFAPAFSDTEKPLSYLDRPPLSQTSRIIGTIRITQLQRGILILNKSLDCYKAEPFVKDLLTAIEACGAANSLYPKHFPIQLLQAFLLLKSTDYRQTLLEEWKHTPHLTSPLTKGLLEGESEYSPLRKKVFLSRRIQKAEYREEITAQNRLQLYGLPPFKGVQNLMEHVSRPDDTLAIHQADTARRRLPFAVNQSIHEVQFKIGKDGPEVSSTDCCEASFLNFFLNIPNMIGDLDSLGTLSFEDARARLREKFPKLQLVMDYIQRYGLSPSDPQARSLWKSLVSNIPGVSYFQKVEYQGKPWRFDMRPSVDKFIRVAEYFLESEYPLDSPPISRQQRVKRICELFQCNVHFNIENAEPQDPTAPWDSVGMVFDSKLNKGSLVIDVTPLHCHAHWEKVDNASNLASDLLYPVLVPGSPSSYRPGRSLISTPRRLSDPHSQSMLYVRDEIPIPTADKDVLIQILGSTLSRGETSASTFEKMISWANEPGRPSILPILLGPRMDSADEVFLVASTILKRKITEYYPFALSLLNDFSLDGMRMVQMVGLLEEFIKQEIPPQLLCATRELMERVIYVQHHGDHYKSIDNADLARLEAYLERTKSRCGEPAGVAFQRW